MQDIAGIDRQQRRGAAQQHGKEIERNGAQHHRARTHELHAFDDALETRRQGFLRREAPSAQLAHDQRGGAKAGDAKRIDRHRAEGIEKAAQRGARDDGAGEGRGIGRDGAGQALLRHQEGQQRLSRGAGKAARRAEQHQHGIEHPGGVRPENAEGQEQGAAGGLQPRRQAIDAALVEAVGDVARRQGQQEHGQELAKAHQPQRQRRALHVVNLPADRHRLDLHRHGGNETRANEEIEIAGAVDRRGNFTHPRS